MINLTIGKTTDTNGATLYTLTPTPVVLGNQNANAVDEVQVAGIPAEWAGLTIRAVFVPTPGAAVACILDENGRCTVSASFTGNRGEIVVDAFGEDYHAYTTPAKYTVARHQDISETVDPEYTPTQVEQILAQAQTYANDAQDARDAAQDAAASIQDMTVSAETLPAGSDASVTKTETPTVINLEFGIPRGADGQVQDVTIDGTSIVNDGVADIPHATSSTWGLFKPYTNRGLYTSNVNGAYIVKALDADITARGDYKPIVPSNLDYAVKAALTDGVGTAYTDAEKAAAHAYFGGQRYLLANFNLDGNIPWLDTYGSTYNAHHAGNAATARYLMPTYGGAITNESYVYWVRYSGAIPTGTEIVLLAR